MAIPVGARKVLHFKSQRICVTKLFHEIEFILPDLLFI